MGRWRLAASFVVTLGVLALLVALSLRQARAQTEGPEKTTTLVAYHPVATLMRQESALVHVVNLGRDLYATPEVFRIMFLDTKGVLLGTEQQCEIRAGETCSVPFDVRTCPQSLKSCAFRAVVVGQQLPCVTPDMGTGDWMTNLELFGNNNVGNVSKYIAGETPLLSLPTEACAPPDAPPPDAAPPDAPAPDAAPPDAPPPDAPPPDAPPPDAPPPDAPPPDAPPPDAPPPDAPPPDAPPPDAAPGF